MGASGLACRRSGAHARACAGTGVVSVAQDLLSRILARRLGRDKSARGEVRDVMPAPPRPLLDTSLELAADVEPPRAGSEDAAAESTRVVRECEELLAGML